MRRTKKRNDEQPRRAGCRNRGRALFVHLENDNAFVCAHDAKIGCDRYRNRMIAAAHGEEIDAIAASNLGQGRGEPRHRYCDGPGRNGKPLRQRSADRRFFSRTRWLGDQRREERCGQQHGTTPCEKEPAARDRESLSREGQGGEHSAALKPAWCA